MDVVASLTRDPLPKCYIDRTCVQRLKFTFPRLKSRNLILGALLSFSQKFSPTKIIRSLVPFSVIFTTLEPWFPTASLPSCHFHTGYVAKLKENWLYAFPLYLLWRAWVSPTLCSKLIERWIFIYIYVSIIISILYDIVRLDCNLRVPHADINIFALQTAFQHDQC